MKIRVEYEYDSACGVGGYDFFGWVTSSRFRSRLCVAGRDWAEVRAKAIEVAQKEKGQAPDPEEIEI